MLVAGTHRAAGGGEGRLSAPVGGRERAPPRQPAGCPFMTRPCTGGAASGAPDKTRPPDRACQGATGPRHHS
jgi:hypothetical protein